MDKILYLQIAANHVILKLTDRKDFSPKMLLIKAVSAIAFVVFTILSGGYYLYYAFHYLKEKKISDLSGDLEDAIKNGKVSEVRKILLNFPHMLTEGWRYELIPTIIQKSNTSTPARSLVFAAYGGHLEVIKFLHHMYNIDLNNKDHWKRPLDAAIIAQSQCTGDERYVAKCANLEKTIEYLAEKGAKASLESLSKYIDFPEYNVCVACVIAKNMEIEGSSEFTSKSLSLLLVESANKFGTEGGLPQELIQTLIDRGAKVSEELQSKFTREKDYRFIHEKLKSL